MTEFPILKWVSVDGRNVPFTYPQHKKGTGYVETGDENPLPVGNHVMSEGGLWIPEPEVRDTRVTGSNVEKRIVSKSTEPMPQGENGWQLFFWDTREVFLHDGTDWREV